MASTEDDDAPAWLRRLAGTYRGVRFGRGLVGKTSYAVVGLIPVWLVIVWRLSGNPALDGALVGSGAIITAGVLWWTRSTQRFAERNPAQAMLDGGELLEYQRFEAQMKGGISIENKILTADPLQPIPMISSAKVEEPDV